MLTDIFAYRYLKRPIWPRYTEIERRLLNQAFGIVKDTLPYYNSEGKEIEENKAKWKLLHDQLARELGLNELSTRYYSYTSKGPLGQDWPVSGWFSWDHVCDQFVNATFAGQADADPFIKERFSFVELALRLRGEEVAKANLQLPQSLHDAAVRDARPQMGIRLPGSQVDGVKAMNAKMNSVYEAQVAELNERFRRANAPLTYHNGFIQVSVDERIELQIAKPFWQLVSDPLWKM